MRALSGGHHPPASPGLRLAAAAAVVLGCLIFLAGSPDSGHAAPSTELQRYPYLTDLVGGSATINWATVASGTDAASVKYGPLGSCTANTVTATRLAAFSVNGQQRWQWKANLSGLSGDTSYCYRVYKGSVDLLGTDPSPSFKSQVPAGSSSPYSFVVFGDWGQGSTSGNPHQTNLFQRIATSGARFALSTGDVPYGGSSQTQYGDLTYAASDVFGTTGWPVAGKSVAMFNALGNHGRSVEYLNNWPSSTAASTSGGRFQMDSYPSMNGTNPASYPSAWYAFDAGKIRFYVLDASWSNSNLGTTSGSTSQRLYKNDYDQHWQPGRPEYQWLKADLEANPNKAKVAVFHFPLWSANTNESSDGYLQGATSLEGLLTTNGVKLAFNGHAHHYQRNTPSALGLTTYISGGGGATLHSISCSGSIPSFTAYAIAWSGSSNVGSKCPSSVPTPSSSNQVYHFIEVEVNGTTVTVRPTNEDGVTFDVQTFNLAPTVDTPPTVSITQPTQGATVSGSNVQLSASAGDDQGVAGVQFRVDGVDVGSEDTAAPYELTWDSTTATNGSHTITAVARDTANQTTTSAGVDVTVSNGAPPPATGINFVRQASAASTSGTTLNVGLAATAGDALVASIAVAAGGSKSVTAVTDSTGAAWTRGPVGYRSGSNTRVEMWYRVNVPGGITQVTATLSASGVASANVSEWSGVVGTSPLDGMAAQGNASSTVAATPEITTTHADDLLIASLNYSGAVSSTLSSPGFAPLDNFNAGTSTNGRSAYRIVSSTGAYSAAWTLSPASASGTAILALKGAPPPPTDPEAPSVIVTEPDGFFPVSGSVLLKADATDNVGVVGVQFQVDGTDVGAEDTTSPYEATWDTTTASNGAHSVTAVARDAAGNTTTSDPVSVTVSNADTVSPTVQLTAPANGAAVGGATVTVSAAASDNVAVAGVQFKDGSNDIGTEDVTAPYSVTWDTTGLPEGTHTLTAVARDPTGNTTTSDSISVTVDNTQPTVSVTQPSDGATVQGTVSVTADADDAGGSGVAGVQFRIDGNDLGTLDASAPYSASWDTTAVANGSSHAITAIAVDAAGNATTSAQVSATVDNPPAPDTTPPQVSISAPSDGAAVRGTVPVNASASDDVAVAGVQFKLDGADLGSEDTVAPYSVDWDSASATEGEHTLTAVARDTASPANVTTAAAVTVTVDRTDPVVTVTDPTDGETVGGTVSLAAAASDTGGTGVSSVQFRVDGTDLGSPDTSAPYSASWNTSALAEGSTHSITAVATDKAGNSVTSGPIDVTVENTAPPAALSFVRQSTGSSASGTALGADIGPAAGNALVATIAIAAGSSKSVTTVTDSTGGAWTRASIGYQSGSNTRVELWYRVNVPAGITRVTATLSASGAASVNVSEWAGVLAADAAAGRGNASSTTAGTPTITTTHASAVVIGAVNYPGGASSTLATAGFTGLSDFDSGASTNGRAAYRIVSATGAYDAAWTLSAASTSGSVILALKGGSGGPPPPTDDPPSVSVTAPSSGATVSGSAVSLQAAANDDVEVSSVQFRVDGTNLGTADTTAPYQVTWDSTAVSNGPHVVTAVARDSAGQTTTSSDVPITVDNSSPPPPPSAISLVRQTTASASSASLVVPITPAGAGNTLVAVIALATGGSKSVTAVTDSAGGTWIKGPVGFQSGSNSRVEIWYRSGVGAGISDVTATISASAAVSASVSEWAGVAAATPLDAAAGRGNASGTIASTPTITTANADDVVIGAINYPGSGTSSLTGSEFTALDDFDSGASTNGRAAYRIATATGAYQVSWSLSAAATSGAAILALKGA